MTKSLKIMLCVVMALALAVIAVCSLRYLNLSRDYAACEKELAESRKIWESIAAEKETLQVDLKAKQNDLKVAQLSLEENTARAEELRTDIEKLKADIEQLKQQKTTEP